MFIFQTISKTHLIPQCKLAFTNFSALRSSNLLNKFKTGNIHERALWGYVAIAFNKVDKDRLSQVGPDRLCAEWMLKNGGAVGLVGMHNRVLKDYNSLPPESVKFYLQVIDATNASIMKMGLDHFAGCRRIDTVIFHNCKHLEDGGLEGLVHLKSTLKRLQVSGCYNLRDSCFDVVAQLSGLEQLRLFDLIYLKDIQGVATKLRQALPNCKIEVRASQ